MDKVVLIFLIAWAMTATGYCGEEDGRLQRNTYDFEALTDAHLHIQSISQAPALIEAMDAGGITRAALVGSPHATVYGNQSGYRGYKNNNRQVLRIADKYEDRFIPLVALDPENEEKLHLLKEYLDMGAKGIKLYSGHSTFYKNRLDAPDMYPVYELASRRRLPVIFHVNAGKPDFLNQFERVLNDFPGLKVVCPHFCFSSIKLSRLERLLKKYPNLYTDISFGDFMAQGLRRISKQPVRYRNFMLKFSDRILFATDMVVTDNPRKDVKYLAATQRAYRSMLEKKEYYYPYMPGEKLRGLALERGVLKKIYSENSNEVFDSQSYYE